MRIYIIIILITIITSLHPKMSTKRHPQDVFNNHITFIESHRGINREIFENTLEAFQKAIDYGIESFETDVWLTKDYIPIILHGGKDGELKGYYDHSGKVTELTWEELQTFHTIEDNLKMPSLRQTMELTKNKIFMNLEIKDPRSELVFPKIIELIEEFNYFDQIVLSSFHHEYYNYIKDYNEKNDNKLVFGFLYRKGHKSYFNYNYPGYTLNIYWKDATKEVCDKAHRNGMAIVVWFSMYEEESTYIYKNMIENGVDVICCNAPLLAKIYRDSYYSLDNTKFFKGLKRIFKKLLGILINNNFLDL